MQPTAIEKLTLLMLCDIYKELDIQDSFDPDLIRSAVSSGDTWVLNWAYDLEEGVPNPPHVTAVVDTLDMYGFLRDSFEDLDADDVAAVESAVPRARSSIIFRGYDGNNEIEYLSAAQYMVENLGRFESMKAVASLNSHMPVVGMYARMYEVFKPIRGNLGGRLMSSEEIIAVLQAMTHPARR